MRVRSRKLFVRVSDIYKKKFVYVHAFTTHRNHWIIKKIQKIVDVLCLCCHLDWCIKKKRKTFCARITIMHCNLLQYSGPISKEQRLHAHLALGAQKPKLGG